MNRVVDDEPDPDPAAMSLSAEQRDELMTPRLGLWVDVVTHRYSTAERYASQVAARVGRPVVGISDFFHRAGGVLRVGVDLGPIDRAPDQALRRAMIRIGHTEWSRPSYDGGILTTCWTDTPPPDRGVARIEIVAGRPIDDERCAPEVRAAIIAGESAPESG